MVDYLATDSLQKTFEINGKTYHFANIAAFLADHGDSVESMPYTIRVLLEAALRRAGNDAEKIAALTTFVNWDEHHDQDVSYNPERVILQDFTGVPALVDLAAMRDALAEQGGDVQKINPEVPVDLVIDHSVQVDRSGDDLAFDYNIEKEFERNEERYKFLKWAQGSFDNLTVIPPDTGIIHQVNLERLAQVIRTKENENGELEAFPDTLVGTDSHTTMINGLGVLGWGVGGIEAEASMLGETSFMPMPRVVGVKLTGKLNPGVTATDLALTLTNQLRNHGVVGKFVEYYGSGLAHLPLAYRATIANMAPEYGATCGFFPVDQQTLEYLKLTSRPDELINLVEEYSQANHFFYDESTDSSRHYSEIEELDLSTVESSVAGPSRPQDIVKLANLPAQFEDRRDMAAYPVQVAGQDFALRPGSLGIAAITSCTNTSNPQVLIAAALIAKKAVEFGLKVPAYVKTSFAPGSRVVTDYLKAAGLQDSLDAIGFNLVGYGCTTCIGNSGQLLEELQQSVVDIPYPIAAVESGNRNFEGRVNPLVKDTYLASPPLVVIYALAGTLDIDVTTEPVGVSTDGTPVYLTDLWPADEDVDAIATEYIKPEQFSDNYSSILKQNETWNALQAPSSVTYEWDDQSTYIASPPFFEQQEGQPSEFDDMRALASFGDSITTDHISPAGFIGSTTPAGKYLASKGVPIKEFNSYGSRRGHHDVMMRGTLANIRLRNQLVPDKTGGFTRYLPTNQETTIFDAAMQYKQDQTPLVILAGKDYGMGSSRDWAAKGVKLLGVKAIIAESFERIHRSNLVMMGIVPLEYQNGDTAESLGLDGTETFDIKLNQTTAHVIATKDTKKVEFDTKLRFDTPKDWEYYENGGILPLIVKEKSATTNG
ncbi:aconitate hydratase AcnA [Paucilactobacillus nenjiangensis]|uniref:aconitate hydratase AcnA n=1 Tax=Paucilactobacillus nenjiangensis TaxID=1296540 RepID=UPI003F977C29